jgi:AraC-like DNA-binding protein
MSLPPSLVRGIRYRNPDWPGMRLEAVPMRSFWTRAAADFFLRPRRPSFHHLFLCSAGAGHHTVDFQRLELEPGTVVHVRPGQVQAFGWNPDLDGVLLMFTPEALLAEPARHRFRFPPLLRLAPVERAWAEAGFRHLLAEYARTDGGATSERALQHLLAALCLQLGQLAPPASGPGPDLLQQFEADLERHFLESRTVADYARRLGYAERTLVRAARAAGRACPKTLIAERVLLEAKRLLAQGDLGSGRIAAHLGFSEPTNFTKFFRKGTGMTPEAFRRLAGEGGALGNAIQPQG